MSIIGDSIKVIVGLVAVAVVAIGLMWLPKKVEDEEGDRDER